MLFNYVGLIRAEENRILFEMCQTISQNRKEIKEAVTAIAEIDVFRAKAKVGLRMRGIIPEVCTCSVYIPDK
jgi:dsDNA-specific endonuclease/ATPase MutS2